MEEIVAQEKGQSISNAPQVSGNGLQLHSLICYGSGFVGHRYHAQASFTVPGSPMDHAQSTHHVRTHIAKIVNHPASWSAMYLFS